MLKHWQLYSWMAHRLVSRIRSRRNIHDELEVDGFQIKLRERYTQPRQNRMYWALVFATRYSTSRRSSRGGFSRYHSGHEDCVQRVFIHYFERVWQSLVSAISNFLKLHIAQTSFSLTKSQLSREVVKVLNETLRHTVCLWEFWTAFWGPKRCISVP